MGGKYHAKSSTFTIVDHHWFEMVTMDVGESNRQVMKKYEEYE